MGENFDGSFFGYENVWEKIKGCGIFNSVPFKGYEKFRPYSILNERGISR